MSEYIFKRAPEEYFNTIKPMNNYIDQAATYLSINHKLSKPEAVKQIKEILVKHKLKNPTVTYRHRDDKGDRTMESTKLNDYINNVIENDEILTPTFTVMDNPKVKKSLHADFLANNIKLRSVDKKLSFKYKQEGDKDKFLYHDVLQKVRKIFNNSLSGAYASKSTILYHPAAHSILTSITRSVASIGNAVSESIIAGNKYFKTPDHVLNYITSICAEFTIDNMDYVLNKYHLHIPTVDEVMEMIHHSADNYWTDSIAIEKIYTLVTNLAPQHRVAVVYLNDLYHLKKHNEDFVKTMLFNMSKRCETGSDDNLKDINNAPEGIMNLVHHICMSDIQGMTVNYKELQGTKLLEILASTARNVTIEINKYKKLFRTLLTSDILPINIAEVKDMLRDAIVLSDTDSTCGSYDNWVIWGYGNSRFTPEAVGLAATVMTINTQAIDHNIKVFAKNMNIENGLVEMLKMKNEFFWSSFVVANVSKHYYADTWIREGNVYDEADLELKGVHFISSAGMQEVAKRAKVMMGDINSKVAKGEHIEPLYYIKQVVDTENMLLNLIEQGSVDIFKTEKIKSLDSYKLDDPGKTPFFYHLMWKSVFSEEYGDPGDPEYMVIKVPTILSKPAKLKEYLANLEDVTYKNNLTNILSKYNKTSLGIMRVPLAIASGGRGVPKEILKIVDTKRMVSDSLNVMYLVLESIGIFNKSGLMFREMGYL